MTETEEFLEHYGVKGMRWGVRKAPDRLSINKTDTKITKEVKKDYNNSTNKEFRRKYAASKKTYAKRVEKYGDPYKHRRDGSGGKITDSKTRVELEKAEIRKVENYLKTPAGQKQLNGDSSSRIKPPNKREGGSLENQIFNRVASSLDTGGNVANSILYSPLGAVVIAKKSSAYGRGGSKEDRAAGKAQKRSERISTRIDTGSDIANALLMSPVSAVVIMARSEREGR